MDFPSPSGSEKDLQLNFGKNMTVQVEMRAPHLPAEWHTQSGIQLTWPHAGTDWAYMLAEVQECFINIAKGNSEARVTIDCHPRTGRSEKTDSRYRQHEQRPLSGMCHQ